MTGRLLAGWWAAIWPNLAASALWAAPALTHLHLKLNRQFRATLAPHSGIRQGEDSAVIDLARVAEAVENDVLDDVRGRIAQDPGYLQAVEQLAASAISALRGGLVAGPAGQLPAEQQAAEAVAAAPGTADPGRYA